VKPLEKISHTHTPFHPYDLPGLASVRVAFVEEDGQLQDTREGTKRITP